MHLQVFGQNYSDCFYFRQSHNQKKKKREREQREEMEGMVGSMSLIKHCTVYTTTNTLVYPKKNKWNYDWKIETLKLEKLGLTRPKTWFPYLTTRTVAALTVHITHWWLTLAVVIVLAHLAISPVRAKCRTSYRPADNQPKQLCHRHPNTPA